MGKKFDLNEVLTYGKELEQKETENAKERGKQALQDMSKQDEEQEYLKDLWGKANELGKQERANNVKEKIKKEQVKAKQNILSEEEKKEQRAYSQLANQLWENKKN